LFGVVLLIFVLATAYGFAPSNLVNRIPGFNFNGWHRTGVLMGLTIAILSAHFISWLHSTRWGRNKRHATQYLIVAAIFFQALDLSVQFHNYNSTPPREAYFPTTRSIEFVQNNLEPFQSVVADRSFIISGTVSNYGLPELFAAGFRNSGQRSIMTHIVDNPFTNPVSSMFPCESINFTSPYAVLAAVRYFLVATDCREAVASTSGTGHKPSQMLNNGPLSGTIKLNRPTKLDIARVLFATWGDDDFASDIGFELYWSGSLVASSTLPADAIHDNQYANFPLNVSDVIPAGEYMYVITMLKPNGESKLSTWNYSSGGDYSIASKHFPGTPKLSLIAPPQVDGLAKHRLEENVTVFENIAVTGGAYYVHSLDQIDGVNFSAVQVTQYQPSDFTLTYTDDRPGYIVIPMRTDDNWVATLNGNVTPISLFHDVFAAVPVSGASEINLRYQHESGVAHWVMSFAAAAFLILLNFAISRRCKMRKEV
jgi:hypothetical protein